MAQLPAPRNRPGRASAGGGRAVPGGSSSVTILFGEVNQDGVSANLSDGVLSVMIPKAEQAKPRRIQVTG